MSRSYQEKKLTRNFQGYAIQLAKDMVGFGLTSIGFIENSYFQNNKDLEKYQTLIRKELLPVSRGYVLTPQDVERREIILSLMCHFEVEKERLPKVNFRDLKEEGFLEETDKKWVATPLGRLFIRLIAAKFDTYLTKGKFSRAV